MVLCLPNTTISSREYRPRCRGGVICEFTHCGIFIWSTDTLQGLGRISASALRQSKDSHAQASRPPSSSFISSLGRAAILGRPLASQERQTALPGPSSHSGLCTSRRRLILSARRAHRRMRTPNRPPTFRGSSSASCNHTPTETRKMLLSSGYHSRHSLAAKSIF